MRVNGHTHVGHLLVDVCAQKKTCKSADMQACSYLD